MEPNPRPARAQDRARLEVPRSGQPHATASSSTPAAPAFSSGAPRSDDMITALWCPHCKTPFVGVIDPSDASFVHPACGGRSVLDLALLDALATESWFWRRYRERLRSEG